MHLLMHRANSCTLKIKYSQINKKWRGGDIYARNEDSISHNKEAPSYRGFPMKL